MMEAVSTIMGINFFSERKLFSTSTSIWKLTNCSQHCRRIDRGVLFFCGSPSLLWFDPRLHLKQRISYLPGHHLLAKFSLCIYSCPGAPSKLFAWAPSRNRTIFDIIDSDNDKFTLTLTISNKKNDKSETHWECWQTAFTSLTMFFEKYLNI